MSDENFVEWAGSSASAYWILLFLLASAFFSASETALLSINKLQKKKLENSNRKNDKRILKILTKPRLLLIAVLLGNTLVNISISSFSAVYALYLNKATGLNLNDSTIITIQIIITTITIVLLGELIPKLIAWAKAYSIAKIVILPLQVIIFLLWPILKLLEFFSVIITKNKNRTRDEEFTTEEFQTIIHSQNSMHSLEEHEKKILAGLFRLPKAELREIIIPRVQIVAIEENQTIVELKKLIINSGYSRIPVYRNTIDDIVGVVYAKDILLDSESKSLKEIMRMPWFVTENMKIQTLLNQFKSNKTQIAIVVDEYGGTSGIITLEDIMEELVGEIKDEYDDDETPSLTKIDNGTYLVSGMCGIRELNAELAIDVNPDKYDNLADFLLECFNKVPKINDIYLYQGKFEFKIMDSNKKRINQVKVVAYAESAEENGNTD